MIIFETNSKSKPGEVKALHEPETAILTREMDLNTRYFNRRYKSSPKFSIGLTRPKEGVINSGRIRIGHRYF